MSPSILMSNSCLILSSNSFFAVSFVYPSAKSSTYMHTASPLARFTRMVGSCRSCVNPSLMKNALQTSAHRFAASTDPYRFFLMWTYMGRPWSSFTSYPGIGLHTVPLDGVAFKYATGTSYCAVCILARRQLVLKIRTVDWDATGLYFSWGANTSSCWSPLSASRPLNLSISPGLSRDILMS